MQHLRIAGASTALLLWLAAPASAQTVQHYWDFSSDNDVVGGLATVQVGTPTLAIDALYGEAYPGAGASLNTVLGGLSAGGGHLSADCFDGVNATALDFGTGDFSFSYWSYDDTNDGDMRGARVFDFLEGTTTGVQLGTNGTNLYNLRLDDDLGGSTITNNSLAIAMPTDAWVHCSVNVDRANSTVEIFFNGASQGTVALASGAAAGIRPTIDLSIGIINAGNDGTGAQKSGLDDLAFYTGLLSPSDIAGLAAGTLNPGSIGTNLGAAYCFGDGTGAACPCAAFGAAGEGCLSTSGSGALLAASGDADLGNDTWQLDISGAPANKPGLFFQGTNRLANVTAGDGLLCSNSSLRYAVNGTDANGNVSQSGFGANAMSGQTLNYQYWYRDTGNPCGAGGFNFSNGWSVTW